MTEVQVYDQDAVLRALVGRRVIRVSDDAMTLDNQTVIRFSTYESECCSQIELTNLATTEHIITAATFDDNEDETGHEGAYKAWLHVVTEAGELNIAEADGEASNGYYLHGFALSMYITPSNMYIVPEDPI